MPPIRARRKCLNPIFIVLAALALGACGGGGHAASTQAAPSTAPAETSATSGGLLPAVTETTPTETRPSTSPESRPGGAGDEQSARVLALFTGSAGRITPPVVRVPAYISVRIELRSADGGDYALVFGAKRLGASGASTSASTTVDGLRPGRVLVGRTPGGATVRIEANAQPGP
jgi:hypothetical protein